MTSLAVCPGTDTHLADPSNSKSARICNRDWSASAFAPGSEVICSLAMTGGSGHTVGMNLLSNGASLLGWKGGKLGGSSSWYLTSDWTSGPAPGGAYSCGVQVDGQNIASKDFTLITFGTVGSGVGWVPSTDTSGSGLTDLSVCPASDFSVDDAYGDGHCTKNWAGQMLPGNTSHIYCTAHVANEPGQFVTGSDWSPWGWGSGSAPSSSKPPVAYYVAIIFTPYIGGSPTNDFPPGSYACQLVLSGSSAPAPPPSVPPGSPGFVPTTGDGIIDFTIGPYSQNG